MITQMSFMIAEIWQRYTLTDFRGDGPRHCGAPEIRIRAGQPRDQHDGAATAR
jgi:hypothetical protein